MASDSLTAKQILGFKKPSELFQMDLTTLDKQLRRFRSEWHPDKNRDALANDVFAKITVLYDQAFKVLTGKLADTTLTVKCRKTERSFSYIMKATLDFGMGYYDDGKVIYAFSADCADLARKYIVTAKVLMQSLHGRLETEFKPFLPVVEETIIDDSGVTYLVVRIPKDHVPLFMLLKYCGGKIDPKHVAWMTSRMLNTAMLYRHAGLVNNTFSIYSYFVNPVTHSGTDIGGLAFSVERGARILALSKTALKFYPMDLLYTKTADSKADIALIKNTVAALLGDSVGNGVALQANKAVPKPLVSWVRNPPITGSVMDEFKLWIDKVLQDSFGKRAFTKMNITAADVFLNY